MGVELALLSALAKKVVDFVRQLRGRDTNAVLTQLFAWLAGIAVVFVGANVDVASAIEIANVSLDQMGLFTQTIIGLVVGSLGSIANDLQSKKVAPPLVPNQAPANEVR
jgi:hypothetical protein